MNVLATSSQMGTICAPSFPRSHLGPGNTHSRSRLTHLFIHNFFFPPQQEIIATTRALRYPRSCDRLKTPPSALDVCTSMKHVSPSSSPLPNTLPCSLHVPTEMEAHLHSQPAERYFPLGCLGDSGYTPATSLLFFSISKSK